MPGAIVKNIPPGANDPAIQPCGIVLHVAVSTSPSLYDWFNGPSGGIESHFYVRFDGLFEQYRSIWFEADAQVAGNSFIGPPMNTRLGFVSIESEGMGDGEWTPEQISTIEQIIAWVKSQSDFPMHQCRAWNDPGLGYHSLFSEWNPNAHTCPGPKRVAQFHKII